jgi:hypothetical protein
VQAAAIALTDKHAQSAESVGAKAAHLAQAVQAGFPVLPGLVIPASMSTQPLRAPLRAAQGGSVHAAQLSVPEPDTDQLFAVRSAIRQLTDGSLAVRSSSPLEADARWSGAFTSFLDVNFAELPVAIRGVWASVVSPAVIGRALAQQIEISELSIAVLIQPFIAPDYGGTATVRGDIVTVRGIAGSPAPLLSGWETGVAAVVDRNGAAAGDRAIALLSTAVVGAVADLAKALSLCLGYDSIEWAYINGQPVILQAGAADHRAASAEHHSASTVGRIRPLPPSAVAAAAHVVRFAGALGEATILPLVLPDAHVPVSREAMATDAAHAANLWLGARQLAARLLSARLGHLKNPTSAVREMLAELQLDPARALESLAELPPVPSGSIADLVGRLEAIGGWLCRTGRLIDGRRIWTLSEVQLTKLILVADDATPPISSRATHRWDGLLFDAVMAFGQSSEGESAAPGTGAGPVQYVDGGPRSERHLLRPVVVAPRPLPRLAPLLWQASALVTFGGSGAAHLVEVAASLGVPAVVACRAAEGLFLDRQTRPQLAAVDGHAGIAAFASAG